VLFFSLRSPLAEPPSVINVACWHLCDIAAAARHVCLSGKTGSDQPRVKMTRLTHSRTRGSFSELVKNAASVYSGARKF
jgi:hypothetical protein